MSELCTVIKKSLKDFIFSFFLLKNVISQLESLFNIYEYSNFIPVEVRSTRVIF